MIGLLGGTFNPVHFGHINMALEILEACDLEKVVFCPAGTNPFKKEDQGQTAAPHRIQMLELALDKIQGCEIDARECLREGVSYACDTIKEYREEGHEVALIIGDDLLAEFTRWKDYEEILSLSTLLVASRYYNEPPCSLCVHPRLFEAVQMGWTPIRMMEISSTDVRVRLEEGLYCGHLVPKNVLDYISSNDLYLKS